MVRVWDKHTFRRDGFLGQVTIKFNTDLLESGGEVIDDWFVLKQRGKKDNVSGSLRLRINYGSVKKAKETKAKEHPPATCPEDSSDDDAEEREKKPLALSQNYHKADPRLERSTHVQIDEDDGTDREADGAEEEEGDYVPARKGKAELTKLSKDSKVTLSSKNLEVPICPSIADWWIKPESCSLSL